VPQKPHGLRRVLHLTSFALSGLPVALWQRTWRPDIVLAVEPTFLSALHALLVAAQSRAKTWLHVQDFELDAAFELGDLPSLNVRNWALAFERKLLRRFDRVSAISERMLERLVTKGVDSYRCVLFPNWVDTKAICPLAGPSPLRQELGIARDRIVVLYSGSMGRKQGLDLLIRAARLHADRKDILYVFSGEGPYRELVIEKTKDLGNVLHLPLQPAERLNDLLNLADIHVLPQRAGVADLVMPSKLTGMLASGRPVVATGRSGTQLAAAMQDCGIVVEPDDADALASAILSLAASADLRRKFGERGRKYALANLDLEVVLCRFESAVQDACAGPMEKRNVNWTGGMSLTRSCELQTGSGVDDPAGGVGAQKPCA
jgi:colanic acid biosynthesis glycosyl transferase WcaI